LTFLDFNVLQSPFPVKINFSFIKNSGIIRLVAYAASGTLEDEN